jgi:hypothetical protein
MVAVHSAAKSTVSRQHKHATTFVWQQQTDMIFGPPMTPLRPLPPQLGRNRAHHRTPPRPSSLPEVVVGATTTTTPRFAILLQYNFHRQGQRSLVVPLQPVVQHHLHVVGSIHGWASISAITTACLPCYTPIGALVQQPPSPLHHIYPLPLP